MPHVEKEAINGMPPSLCQLYVYWFHFNCFFTSGDFIVSLRTYLKVIRRISCLIRPPSIQFKLSLKSIWLGCSPADPGNCTLINWFPALSARCHHLHIDTGELRFKGMTHQLEWMSMENSWLADRHTFSVWDTFSQFPFIDLKSHGNIRHFWIHNLGRIKVRRLSDSSTVVFFPCMEQEAIIHAGKGLAKIRHGNDYFSSVFIGLFIHSPKSILFHMLYGLHHILQWAKYLDHLY